MKMLIDKIIIFLFFALIVLTSFVVADGIKSNFSSGGSVNPILSDVFCQYGNVGDLKIDDINFEVIGFGDDEEWYPLDKIDIEVEIENKGDVNINEIIVKWGIYNIKTNQLFIQGEKNSFNLSKGEKYVILFSFFVDPNILNITENKNDFTFYIKTYSDNKENVQCYYESENIIIRKDDNFVVLNNIQMPDTALGGSSIEINADVWNIGEEKQDDTFVRISNKELEINKQVNIGDIDSFENKKLSTTIEIPLDVEEKTYIFELAVYDEDNDVYENDNDNSDAIFFRDIFIEYQDLISPEISILTPQNSSMIKGDFTFLIVKTNENTICEYSLEFLGQGYGGGHHHIEMETTGESFHMQSIENLKETQEGEKYNIKITCTDESGNSAESEIEFYVNLSELKEVMILENIGDYLYKKSTMIKISEEENNEINTTYFAYYDKESNNYTYSAGIYKFKNKSYFNDFLKEFEEGVSITIEEINGNRVYRLDEGDEDYGILWIHENLMVYVMAAINPFKGTIAETPLPIVEAYLKIYPSDLFIDTTAPKIELIYPKDNYIKKTKSSSYEIDFKFKVSDESEIVSCSLIIDDEVEETKTNIQKDTENVFSIELDRGSYDWQIKCVDSEGIKGFSETKDLKIKKISSSSPSSNDDFIIFEEFYQNNSKINLDNTKNIIEPEIIVLNQKQPEKNKGFFENIWDWIKDFFS